MLSFAPKFQTILLLAPPIIQTHQYGSNILAQKSLIIPDIVTFMTELQRLFIYFDLVLIFYRFLSSPFPPFKSYFQQERLSINSHISHYISWYTSKYDITVGSCILRQL